MARGLVLVAELQYHHAMSVVSQAIGITTTVACALLVGPACTRTGIDEELKVVLFDAFARPRAGASECKARIHGWVYEPEDSTVRKKALETALQAYGLKLNDRSAPYFDRRVNLLMSDNRRGKRVSVEIAGQRFDLPASAPNGHFEGDVTFACSNQESLNVRALSPPSARRRSAGRVHVIRPRGISVISDIDDTVKVTHVLDRPKLLEQTFLKKFMAVPGMAELYRRWAASKVAFHFVSSSPWHLYEPLEEFMDAAGFPPATFHLKLVRVKDRTILDLVAPGTETKPRQVEPILQAFPQRTFVLVGDSGEKDPEVYAALKKVYGSQVARIYIRNVTGASREDPRFLPLFRGIDPQSWRLFEDPALLELPEDVHADP